MGAKRFYIWLRVPLSVRFRGIFWVLTFFLFLTPTLRGEQGIVVAVCDRYMTYFLPSLAHLRENLKCKLPIEVWYSGDELSEKNKKKLGKFEKITFRDISTVLGVPKKQYRGWHIKPWIICLSSFDEVILMDADAYFFENPKQLFSHPGYVETGAFFFRDRTLYVFYSETEEYQRKVAFLRSLITYPSNSVPLEWRYYWDGRGGCETSIKEHQDSGCVAFDKRRHDRGMQEIIKLNEDRAVTYKYVYGDKETYWLGLEIAGEPYYVNPQVALGLMDDKREVTDIVQFLDGHLFFQQKHPSKLGECAEFFTFNPPFTRPVTAEEKDKIYRAYQMRKRF